MTPKIRFSSIHLPPAPAGKRTPGPRGFVYVLLGLLATLVCLLTSCAEFQGQFDKDFVNSRLMQLASNPDEIIPDFAWADHGCESANLAGGGLSGGGGGCPT
jgi:hypothetical protein